MRNSDNFFSFHKTPLSKCSLFIHVIGLRYTVCSVPASADPLNHIGGPAPHYRPGKFTCSTTKNQETITTLREISDLNNDAFVCELRYSRLKTGAPCGRERIEKYNQLKRIENPMGEAAGFIGKPAFKKASPVPTPYLRSGGYKEVLCES